MKRAAIVLALVGVISVVGLGRARGGEIHQLKAANKALEAANKMLQATVKRLNDENAKLKSQVAKLQADAAGVADLKKQIAQLQTQLAAVQAELAAAKAGAGPTTKPVGSPPNTDKTDGTPSATGKPADSTTTAPAPTPTPPAGATKLTWSSLPGTEKTRPGMIGKWFTGRGVSAGARPDRLDPSRWVIDVLEHRPGRMGATRKHEGHFIRVICRFPPPKGNEVRLDRSAPVIVTGRIEHIAISGGHDFTGNGKDNDELIEVYLTDLILRAPEKPKKANKK